MGAYLTLPASLDCALHVHLISPLIISPPGLSPADSLLTASTSCANTRQSPKPPLRTLINHVFRSHLRRGVQTQQQERSLPPHLSSMNILAVKKSSSMSAVKTLPKHLKMSVTQTKPAKSSQDSWLEI